MTEKKATRKSLVTPPTTPTEVRQVTRDLDTIDDIVIYAPTDAQKKAKSRLLVRLEDNPTVALVDMSCEDASKLASYNFKNYWGQAGFKDWLCNKTDFRERVEHLAHMSLDAAEVILRSDDPKLASAQVSLIGKIAELAAKLPKYANSGMLDAVVDQMNKAELAQFIQENTKQLKPAEFQDIVEAESDESK